MMQSQLLHKSKIKSCGNGSNLYEERVHLSGFSKNFILYFFY